MEIAANDQYENFLMFKVQNKDLTTTLKEMMTKLGKGPNLEAGQGS